MSVQLFVICIGPVCVPVWGLLPVLALIVSKLKSFCAKKVRAYTHIPTRCAYTVTDMFST